MNIIVEDYHFHTKGRMINKIKDQESVPEYVMPSIRIIGTKEQIAKAYLDYSNKHDLSLDECFSFQVEKKYHNDGRMNYDYFGEEYNQRVSKKLEKYKKMYKENNNEGLIINLR
jgi:hypothetical protein